MERKDVTSFMYFMWKMWSQEECEKSFAEAMCGHKHIGENWISACRRMDGPNGATEVFLRRARYNKPRYFGSVCHLKV